MEKIKRKELWKMVRITPTMRLLLIASMLLMIVITWPSILDPLDAKNPALNQQISVVDGEYVSFTETIIVSGTPGNFIRREHNSEKVPETADFYSTDTSGVGTETQTFLSPVERFRSGAYAPLANIEFIARKK